MRSQLLACVLTMLGLLSGARAGTDTVISAREQNGELTFRRRFFATNYWVEWAPSSAGPWSGSWQTLQTIGPASNACTVAVPLFFRVVASMTNDSTMVSYYPFELDEVGTVTDQAGGHDATIHGATLVPNGKVGAGCYFDGTNDYLSVAHAPELEFGSSFTLAMWVKRSVSVPAWYVLYVKQTAPLTTGGGSLQIYTNNLPTFDVYRQGTFFATSSVLDTNWHHIVVTQTNSASGNWKFYLDGNQDAVTTIPAAVATGGEIEIGIDYDGVSHPFRGVLDEIMFFSRPLSSAEVKQLYDSQK